jgi:hypothetical protein
MLEELNQFERLEEPDERQAPDIARKKPGKKKYHRSDSSVGLRTVNNAIRFAYLIVFILFVVAAYLLVHHLTGHLING